MDYESILETFENLRIELEYAIADFQRLRIDLENAIDGLERKKPPDDSLVNFADFVKAKPAGASSNSRQCGRRIGYAVRSLRLRVRTLRRRRRNRRCGRS